MVSLTQTPLQGLFHAIAQAQDKAVLSQSVMAKVGAYFAANRWRLWFIDELPILNDQSSSLMKQALSLDSNPVLCYLVQRHAAVHESAILPPGVWQTLCPRADHGHVMIGPVIQQGQLVGGLAVTRHRDDPAFHEDDLADLSALCLHVSTRLEALHAGSMGLGLRCDRLTPREIEIAELVAQGLTNREIGAELWITENSVKQALKRMFRKLEVSTRAEMVSKLSIGGHPTGASGNATTDLV